MLKSLRIPLLLFFVWTQCSSQKPIISYKSETLKIKQLSENSFVHISYLQTDSFGKVSCNGYIYMNKGEALVFDTPSDYETTAELLQWLENTMKQKVKGLVVNHFHIDAIGGITEFHKKNIPTYGNKKTAVLVDKDEDRPKETFDERLVLKVGDKEVVNRYFGEAHTADNIVSYIPDEELIYGGCMVKTIDAGKGNLEDANEQEWGMTIKKIKDAYPNLKTVIPGHGRYGGMELLDYTITLFNTN